jgi:hypothetical protein
VVVYVGLVYPVPTESRSGPDLGQNFCWEKWASARRCSKRARAIQMHLLLRVTSLPQTPRCSPDTYVIAPQRRADRRKRGRFWGYFFVITFGNTVTINDSLIPLLSIPGLVDLPTSTGVTDMRTTPAVGLVYSNRRAITATGMARTRRNVVQCVPKQTSYLEQALSFAWGRSGVWLRLGLPYHTPAQLSKVT